MKLGACALAKNHVRWPRYWAFYLHQNIIKFFTRPSTVKKGTCKQGVSATFLGMRTIFIWTLPKIICSVNGCEKSEGEGVSIAKIRKGKCGAKLNILKEQEGSNQKTILQGDIAINFLELHNFSFVEALSEIQETFDLFINVAPEEYLYPTQGWPSEILRVMGSQ